MGRIDGIKRVLNTVRRQKLLPSIRDCFGISLLREQKKQIFEHRSAAYTSYVSIEVQKNAFCSQAGGKGRYNLRLFSFDIMDYRKPVLVPCIVHNPSFKRNRFTNSSYHSYSIRQHASQEGY